MAGPPKLKRRDQRNQDVQYQCGRADGCSRHSKQGHHRDVTGSARMPDAGIKEGDDADSEKQENEVRDVHSLSCRAKSRHL